MNFLALLVASPMVSRLGLTIVHSTWQVLAIAIVLAISLPWAQRRGANVASAISVLAMSLCLFVPLVTFGLITVPKPVLHSSSTLNVPGAEFIPATGDLSRLVSSHEFSMAIAPDETIQKIASEPEPILASKTIDPANDFTSNAAVVTAGSKPLWNDRFLVWSPTISIAWLVGVILLSCWNCTAWWMAQRLKVRGTIPVTSRIEDAAARLAKRLGIRQAVRLFQSSVVQSPVVVGAWKPIILLPISLVLELPPDQLESLIAHELAHILRRDYLINLLQTAIETLLFYHPAVWWISAQVRRERENCCDDIAVQLTNSRTAYAQALAAVVGARNVTALPAANGGSLLNRIRRVIGVSTTPSVHPSRWLAGVLMLSVGAFTVGIAAFSDSPETAATAAEQGQEASPAGVDVGTETGDDLKDLTDPAVETKGSIRLRVLWPDQKPMEEARIHASVWTDDKSFKANRGYKTDADGVAIVELPKLVKILRIWVRKEGYAPLFVQWWPREQADVRSIPDEYSFVMKKGTIVAGFIKDPDGNPIPKVHVQARRTGGGEDLGGRHGYDTWLAEGEDPNEIDGPKITDQDGRWELRNVPSQSDVELFLTHPDFVGDKYWGGLQKEQQVTTADFRKQTGTIVLKRGVSVTGRVTDPAGEPVEGAVIVWGDDPYFQQGSQEVKTDSDGRYRIPTLAPEKLRITVMAKDWMPDTRMESLSPGMGPVDFELKPGNHLRFRLVNSSSEPVAGAYVGIDRWRGSQALYNHKHPNVIDTQIPDKTDENGIYEWKWAPTDAVTYSIGKEGYAHQAASVVADGSLHTIVLQGMSSIHGTIEDAVSGQPIEAAEIMPIDYFTETFVGVERMNALPIKGGKFAFELERTDLKQGIQIEAKGYRVYRTTKRYAAGEPVDKLQIKLEPAAAYQGRVTTEAGNAVAKARVWLATEYEHVSLQSVSNGGNSRDTYVVDANDQGQFEIIAQIDRYALIVYSDEGFAEVHREANEVPGDIKLKPWARVTGRLVQEGKPMPNCEMTIRSFQVVSPGVPNFSTYFRLELTVRGVSPLNACRRWRVTSELNCTSPVIHRSLPANRFRST